MDYSIVIIIALVVGGSVTAQLAIYSFIRRSLPGVYAFAALMVAVTFYSWGYAFSLTRQTLAGLWISVLVQAVGILSIAALWLILAIQYSGVGFRRPRRAIAAFLAFPVISYLVLVTNPMHELYYQGLSLEFVGAFSFAAFSRGPWYWIAFAYSNVFLVVSTVLYFRTYFITSRFYRRQVVVLLVGSVLPWIANIVRILGLSPYGIDLTPLALAAVSPLFAGALVRLRFLELAPPERSLVFDAINDPILIFDAHFRLVDYNAAAKGTLPGTDRTSLGVPVERQLADFRELVRQVQLSLPTGDDVRIPGKNGAMVFRPRLSQITHRHGRAGASVLILHDITEHSIVLDTLRRLATVDDLTGVFNRRYVAELGRMELERSRRYGRPFAVVLLDIDHFKRINDGYGHPVGDEVLVEIAERCLGAMRVTDAFGRFGGEEFAVIVPESDEAQAVRIAEKLRRAIEERPFASPALSVTASFGVAALPSATTETLEDLLYEADKALYRAKSNGRNRVESVTVVPA